LAISLVAASLGHGGQVLAQSTSAQPAPSAADLAAGRQLFVEALSDEEHGRYAEALAKYGRVLALRDTGNIRYRMGNSLEHLGKIVQAVESYRAAVRLSNASTPPDLEVARAAQGRVDALDPKIAHLTVRMPSPPPPDAEVTVDGEPVATSSLGDISLDPGTHVVAASGKGVRSFRASSNLSEGARVEVPIVLEPIAAPLVPPPAEKSGSPTRTIGIIVGAAGGVLLVGGVIVLALRSSAIGTLEDSCPNGACPASREDELRSTHDRAKLEGPLGIALLATGAAALGTGVFLFATSARETKTVARVAPAPGAQGAMMTFGGTF